MLWDEVDCRQQSRVKDTREVILRIAAAHQDKRALDILGMELAYVTSVISKLMIVRDVHCPRNHATNVIWSSESFPPLCLLISPRKTRSREPHRRHRRFISNLHPPLHQRLSRSPTHLPPLPPSNPPPPPTPPPPPPTPPANSSPSPPSA